MRNRHAVNALSVASLTLLGCGLLAQPAAAASSSGAQVDRITECVDYAGFAMYCRDQHIVYNITRTPSGNLSAQGKTMFRSTLTQYATGCVNEDSGENSFHSLALHGSSNAQEVRVVQTHTFRYSCGDLTVTCTSEVRLHFAGGQYQFERYDSHCS